MMYGGKQVSPVTIADLHVMLKMYFMIPLNGLVNELIE
jgi:hypothetical protein